jgi:hypothetical protein
MDIIKEKFSARLVKYVKKQNVSKLAMLTMMFLLLVSVSHVAAFTPSDDGGGDTTTTETTHSTTTEADHSVGQYRESDGSAWIQTDVMTAVLDPQQPTFQFWYTNNDNGSLARFMVSYRMIVEFQDLNGDGAYQPNETIAFAPLDAFEWSLQTGTITDANNKTTEVFASYTKGGLNNEWESDWYKGWMPGLNESESNPASFADDSSSLNFTRFSGMTLRFYAHLYTSDHTANITDDSGIHGNYTIAGGSELKVDVEIGNFPFLSNTSKVAVLNYLRDDVASSHDSEHSFTVHENHGEVEVHSQDTSHDYGIPLVNQDSNHDGQDDSVQHLSLVDSAANLTQGLYTWLDKAVVTFLNGSQIAVNVDASFFTDGYGLLLFLAYPNFDGGSITHDPSMKLLVSGNPVQGSLWILGLPIETIALIGVAAAIIVVAGFAIRRR